MISIWLCPDNDDELYIQNIINDLSDIHNCARFYPHCTLLSGVKENKNDLEKIEQIWLVKKTLPYSLLSHISCTTRSLDLLNLALDVFYKI